MMIPLKTPDKFEIYEYLAHDDLALSTDDLVILQKKLKFFQYK